MRDVITIGAAVRDVFLLSDHFQLLRSDAFETGVGECVPLGSKIDIDQKVETTGGGATNAAVTFARLGLTVSAVCRVGEDLAGREVVTDLSREGVDTTLIRHVRGGETAYSALLTAKGGERSVLTYRGVSAEFKPADIPWDALHARAIYLTSLAGNLPLALRIVRHASRNQTMVAWNPGHKELSAGLHALAPALGLTSFLVMNREEAETLTGERDPKAAFHALARAGAAGAVVITDGAKGAHAFFRDRGWKSGTTEGIPSVSRTGAGDAFGSGAVAALLHGHTLPQALAVGTLNAESVVGHVGAKHGILKKWPGRAGLARISVKPITL